MILLLGLSGGKRRAVDQCGLVSQFSAMLIFFCFLMFVREKKKNYCDIDIPCLRIRVEEN